MQDSEGSKLPRLDRKFVNRKQEVEAIKTNLHPAQENNCRCVLVHGAVGMGKTATAIKAANEIQDNNDNTAVVYIHCGDVSSLDDLAEKISGQMYNFPSNASTLEVKRRLVNQEDLFIILLLDNFQYLDPLVNNDEANRHPEIKRIDQTEGFKIKEFMTEIIAAPSKVKLLITSSVAGVVFPEIFQQSIGLTPLGKDESFELLTVAYSAAKIELHKEIADRIAEICSGIPLALISLASWHDHPPDLLQMMENASTQERLKKFITIRTANESKKIDVCLDACFYRLDENLQDTLICLTLFRGHFTISKARNVFPTKKEIQGHILKLAQRSFLEKDISGGPSAPGSYSLLTVQKLYCQNKAKERRLLGVLDDARKFFIIYFLSFLETTFQKFLSPGAFKACTSFRREVENIMQLLDFFNRGAMNEKQTLRCIDVFNKVVELLAKMMGEKRFEVAFSMLSDKCKLLRDKKRLSMCLTSLGIKETFSCFFTTHPSQTDEAVNNAVDFFTKAEKIQKALKITKGNSRAQCLAKYGRCVSLYGRFKDGKEMIEEAIEIRRKGVRKRSDVIMLGATYNDLAVVLSVEAEDHKKAGRETTAKKLFEKAITCRTREVLPIYRDYLGEHPFTATVLNNLSKNYRALGKFEDAKRCSEEALAIRRKFLRVHKETTLSLFESAMVLKETYELQEAKRYLEQCLEMQTRVLDENNRDIESTKNELKEVCKKLEERSKKLSTKVIKIPLAVYSIVCNKLNLKQVLRFNDFRMLAEKVGLTRDEADLLDQKCHNPTDEIFKTWARKGEEATVEKLIEWLRMDDFNREDVANVLEDWLNEEPSD